MRVIRDEIQARVRVIRDEIQARVRELVASLQP